MSAPKVVPVAVTDRTCGPGEIVHYWCCDENRAWCGEDLTDSHDCPDDCGCSPCVVCVDLRCAPCPSGCNT